MAAQTQPADPASPSSRGVRERVRLVFYLGLSGVLHATLLIGLLPRCGPAAHDKADSAKAELLTLIQLPAATPPSDLMDSQAPASSTESEHGAVPSLEGSAAGEAGAAASSSSTSSEPVHPLPDHGDPDLAFADSESISTAADPGADSGDLLAKATGESSADPSTQADPSALDSGVSDEPTSADEASAGDALAEVDPSVSEADSRARPDPSETQPDIDPPDSVIEEPEPDIEEPEPDWLKYVAALGEDQDIPKREASDHISGIDQRADEDHRSESRAPVPQPVDSLAGAPDRAGQPVPVPMDGERSQDQTPAPIVREIDLDPSSTTRGGAQASARRSARSAAPAPAPPPPSPIGGHIRPSTSGSAASPTLTEHGAASAAAPTEIEASATWAPTVMRIAAMGSSGSRQGAAASVNLRAPDDGEVSEVETEPTEAEPIEPIPEPRPVAETPAPQEPQEPAPQPDESLSETELAEDDELELPEPDPLPDPRESEAPTLDAVGELETDEPNPQDLATETVDLLDSDTRSPETRDDPIERTREAELSFDLGITELTVTVTVPEYALPGAPSVPGTVTSSAAVLDQDLKVDRVAAIDAIETPLGRYRAELDEVILERWLAADLPVAEQALGITGDTTVIFRVRRNGKVENLHLTQSSGYSQIDKLALFSIPDRLPPIPRKLGMKHVYHRYIFHYRAGTVSRTSEP